MPLRRSLVHSLAIGLLLCASAPAPARADGEPADAARRFTRVLAPDGIQIRRFNKTDGAQPDKKDRVAVHYRGQLADGTVFDQSRLGRPASFRLDGVIPCWKEALTRLRVGERAEIVCPPEVAYGAKGSPPRIPANARLTFEVELVGIE